MDADNTSGLLDDPDSRSGHHPIERRRSSEFPMKDGDDTYIRVNNFVLLKHVKDDPDIEKGLHLVATFIQYINDEDNNFKDAVREIGSHKELMFRYRINDEDANQENGMVHFRKTEQNESIIKSTLSVKAPLEITCHKKFFPFIIKKASLEVELCTLTTNKNETKLRPSLCLNMKQKSGNILIQAPKHPGRMKGERKPSSIIGSIKSDFCECFGYPTESIDNDSEEQTETYDKKSDDKATFSKIDRSLIYDFISPFPDVSYDVKGNKDCSKFQISFYLVESGLSNCVKFVLPVLLVCIMNALHVRTNAYTEHTDYLANSAAFALTIVFILPGMCPKQREESIYCLNTLYILIIFVGLILSSIPAGIFCSYDNILRISPDPDLLWPRLSALPSFIGAAVFFSSLLIPLINFGRYRAFENRLGRELAMHKNHFQQNDGEKKFKLKKDRFTDFYSSICGLTKKKLNDIGYTKLAGKKSSTVTYFVEKKN